VISWTAPFVVTIVPSPEDVIAVGVWPKAPYWDKRFTVTAKTKIGVCNRLGCF